MPLGSVRRCARWNEHIVCVRPIWYVYWAYAGAEWWPTEVYLCTTCADAAVSFLSSRCKPEDLAAFSRERVDQLVIGDQVAEGQSTA